jgi:SPP1 gp7 family putative phage head morphogenesis protein
MGNNTGSVARTNRNNAAGRHVMPPVLAAAFTLPPHKAIDYIERKTNRLSWDWTDTWDEQHVRSFTVAKAARMDVLEDIRDAVQTAQKQGWPFQKFQQELRPRLKAKGWWGKVTMADDRGAVETVQLGSPWRLRTIYHTNMQTALMAGRYEGMMSTVRDRPFWQHISVVDSRTTDKCRELHLRIYRYDDPVWDTFYPPSHWGCRRRVRSLSRRQIHRSDRSVESSRGKLVKKQIPIHTRRGTRMADVTGLQTTDQFGQPTTVWTDPGFNYNPGKAAWRPDPRDHDRDLYRAYSNARRNRGIAHRVEIEHVHDLHDVMRLYADEHPGMFPRGFRELRVRNDLLDGAYAATDGDGVIGLSGLYHSSRGIGRDGNWFDHGEYMPAYNLRDALTKMRQRRSLSFLEEYAVETLWHEILHNRARGATLGISVAAERVMEAANQYVSRRTYQRFMRALGAAPRHQPEIIERGPAYWEMARNMSMLTDYLQIESKRALRTIETTLMRESYANMELAIAAALSRASGAKMSSIRQALSELKLKEPEEFTSALDSFIGVNND